MKLSHLLIAGLLSSSLIASANTGTSTSSVTGDTKPKKELKHKKKTETKKVKPTQKKSTAVVSIKKADVCEACGRG